MALTSNDETDLLLPLFHGMQENPRFSAFLTRLQRRTGADYAALLLRPGPEAELAEHFAGLDLRQRARSLGMAEPFDLDRVHYDALRPGRVYSISELVEHDPVLRAERAQRMFRLGMADERVVRITGEESHSAWLMLVRAGPCSAADSALLSSLSPYVGIAVATMLAAERERLQSRIAAASLARARKGWLMFDRGARLIALDPETAHLWRERSGSEPRLGERLPGVDTRAQRDLAAVAAQMADDPGQPARPLVLRQSPRLEALLMPVEPDPNADLTPPALLALLPLERPRAGDGARRLAAGFDLPAREAELALALADGLSIAEAAEAMGLTLETARNYSKRLYAKLGVRGQAELVRLVYESSAVLA